MGFNVRKVPEGKLGRSEPVPWLFGNPDNERGNPAWTHENWLQSRFHFAFAEYRNPRNAGFGCLRVMNDDLVQPQRGFGAHPHRDMEIATYVVDGRLTHKDSMGTEETLTRGAIQFMTAGTGVEHQEHNLSPSDPLRFVQIWIAPRRRGLPPNYGSAAGAAAARAGRWAHLVSDVDNAAAATPIKLNQDVNISVAELSGDAAPLPLVVAPGRMAYLLCVEGAARVCGADGEVALAQHDAAEVIDAAALTVAGPCHVLLVEMQYEAGSGRTDL